MDVAQREAVRARDVFNQAICALYGAGASLREIAEALDLSHQRVHQIVDGSRPSIWARVTRRGRAPQPHRYTRCSFCGRAQDEVNRLLAGPGICICNHCVELAGRAVRGGAPQSDERATFGLPEAGTDARCNFCGKGSRKVRRITVSSGGAICDQCL